MDNPNSGTQVADPARTAEIDAARPSWARRPPATSANGAPSGETRANGANPSPAPKSPASGTPNLKDAISAATDKLANGEKGPNENPGGTDQAPNRGTDGKFQPANGAPKPADAAGDPSAPVKVVFPVMGKSIAIEMTKAEADFLEKNPRFKAQIQKSIGADLKFEQAARMNADATKVFDMFKDKSQIERALKVLGYENPREVFEELLYKHIEVERMTPEQREAHENRSKLAQLEAEKQQRESADKEVQHKKLTDHYSNEYQTGIVSAVSSSGLPATEETIGRVAFYMHAALTQLGKEMTPAQVIPLVREDYKRSFRRFSTASNAQLIAEMLGEEGLTKVREYELNRLKNGGGKIPGVPPQKGPVKGAEPEPKKKPMTMEEFRERNEKIKRGEIIIGAE